MFYLLNVVVNTKITHRYYAQIPCTDTITLGIFSIQSISIYSVFSRSIILASVQTCNMLLVLDMTLKSNIIYDIDHSNKTRHDQH